MVESRRLQSYFSQQADKYESTTYQIKECFNGKENSYQEYNLSIEIEDDYVMFRNFKNVTSQFRMFLLSPIIKPIYIRSNIVKIYFKTGYIEIRIV